MGTTRLETEAFEDECQEAAERANLYAIDKPGTVLIDWEAVETLAASPLDRTFRPTALLMLAIRDGKWKPAR